MSLNYLEPAFIANCHKISNIVILSLYIYIYEYFPSEFPIPIINAFSVCSLRGDEDDEAAKQAYEALLRIALFEPNGPDYDEFSKQVKLRAKEEFNYTYGDEKVIIKYNIGA